MAEAQWREHCERLTEDIRTLKGEIAFRDEKIKTLTAKFHRITAELAKNAHCIHKQEPLQIQNTNVPDQIRIQEEELAKFRREAAADLLAVNEENARLLAELRAKPVDDSGARKDAKIAGLNHRISLQDQAIERLRDQNAKLLRDMRAQASELAAARQRALDADSEAVRLRERGDARHDLGVLLDELRAEKQAVERENARLVEALVAARAAVEKEFKTAYDARVAELEASLRRWETASKAQFRDAQAADARVRAALDEARSLRVRTEALEAELHDARQQKAIAEDKVAILAPSVAGHCAEDVDCALALVRGHREACGRVDLDFLVPVFDRKMGGRLELDELRMQNADLIREVAELNAIIDALKQRVETGDAALSSRARRLEEEIAGLREGLEEEKAAAAAVIRQQAERIRFLTSREAGLVDVLATRGALAADAAAVREVVTQAPAGHLVFGVTIGHVSIEAVAIETIGLRVPDATGVGVFLPVCVTVDAFEHAVQCTPPIASASPTFACTFAFTLEPSEMALYMLHHRPIKLELIKLVGSEAVPFATAEVPLAPILLSAEGTISGLVDAVVSPGIFTNDSRLRNLSIVAGGRAAGAAVAMCVATVEYKVVALRPLPVEWVTGAIDVRATAAAQTAPRQPGESLGATATNGGSSGLVAGPPVTPGPRNNILLPPASISAASPAAATALTAGREVDGGGDPRTTADEEVQLMHDLFALKRRHPAVSGIIVEHLRTVVATTGVSTLCQPVSVTAVEGATYVCLAWFRSAELLIHAYGAAGAESAPAALEPDFMRWLRFADVKILVMSAKDDTLLGHGVINLTALATGADEIKVEVRLDAPPPVARSENEGPHKLLMK